MKFFNLLKKELGELLTLQSFLGVIVVVVMFMFLGTFMKDSITETVKQENSISISDCDNTDFTRELIKNLKDSGAKIEEHPVTGDDYAAIIAEIGDDNIVIIPKGFTEIIESGERPELISVSAMSSAAAMSNISNDNSGALNLIKYCLSNTAAERYGLNPEEIGLINEPVTVSDQTVISDKSANISSSDVMSKLMLQSMSLPIIIFMLIIMTSQTLMSSVSNEKIDKTLETLLSAPVSRMSIILAKMLAAAIYAMINAVIYMLAFSTFMKGATDDVSADLGSTVSAQFMSVDAAMEKLGLVLTTGDYVLIGVQLFLTIMICLALSLMLGALVTDPKQSQTILMPLMLLAMIPYLISMLADLNTLSVPVKIVVYAIPFTHTFSAIQNLMFDHMTIFYAGILYQAIIFALVMFLALRLFNSDKILTLSLNFGQKSKFRKSKYNNEDQ